MKKRTNRVMKRITQGGDINFDTTSVRGLGDNFIIKFYTTDKQNHILKVDGDAIDNILRLEWTELETLGGGVLNYIAENVVPNTEYNDGIYNRTFGGTTDYYIMTETNDEGSAEIAELDWRLDQEIERSTTEDEKHDNAISSINARISDVYTKTEVQELINDIETGEIIVDVVDNLNSVNTNKALSAKQGNVLKAAIEQLRDVIANYAFSGSKPEFSWETVTPEPVITHTVTWTLYGLTMQGSTSVEDGETWTGTITANNGFSLPSELDSVEGEYDTLTYENGVITITNVTGNISIIASGVAVAVLTSPENGSRFNIGDIGMEEQTVSKTLLVKGDNLTKPVTISVSGEGITISTDTLTAAQVNTGTNITITYTNNSAISTTVTGSLTISSDEVSATIALTASKTVIIYHSINNTLTNVANSNADTRVIENSSYSATLTPTLARHILDDDNLTVTMGGVDITEEVYSDGVITIAEVTGDIIITASTITYVTNGLIMHLDYNTIDLVNNKWTSLVSTTDSNDDPLTYEFDLTDVTTSTNGAVFNGTSSKAVSSQVMAIAPTEGTIEFVLGNVTPNTTIPNGLTIFRNTTATYGLGAATWNYGNYLGITRQWALTGSATVAEANLALSKADGEVMDGIIRYLPEHFSSSNTYSAANGSAVTMIIKPEARFTWSKGADMLSIAYKVHSTQGDQFSALTLKGLRVYNRDLTAEEAAHNYKIDKKLFNLG